MEWILLICIEAAIRNANWRVGDVYNYHHKKNHL